MTTKKRNWLITGCSTGLGYALAEHLIASGERVFATARDPSSLAALVKGKPDAHVLKLDVTQAEDIAAAVATVESHGGVDVLVNNAGYGYIAAIEEADEADYRALYETNVFGLIAMTRAVLPGMRSRKQGHIVNIASVGGMIGNPGSGYYAGTKFAVVGFTESLSKETAPLGLKATVVEPGPFRTDWAGRSLKSAKNPIPDYKKTVHDRVESMNKHNGQQPGDPLRAAKAIVAAVDSAEPPLHLVLGKPGLEMARGQLAELKREFDLWEKVSLSADYPD